jgi:hypothetical protein
MDVISKHIDAKGKSVLIIGDTHMPYEHCDYLDFIQAVNKKFKCKIHIHAGDEADFHGISFHNTDCELLSANAELEAVIEKIMLWNAVFPKLELLESNHGSLVFRRMKAHGIPVHLIKPLQQVYNTPEWNWHHDILIETKYGSVYCCHGKMAGYGGLAKEHGTSALQGHYHGKLEVTWHQRVGHKRFNMFVGCGINWKSLAFAYGKNNIPKPILGCGVIDKNGMPHAMKMQIDKHGRWTGKI